MSEVFDSNNPDQDKSESGTNSFDDVLKEITAEDGRQKYSDVESALKSIPSAQNHISTLETELADLREDLGKRKTTEELFAEIDKRSQRGSEGQDQSSVAVDWNKIEQIVERKFEDKSAQSERTKNQQLVSKALQEVFGDKAKEMYEKKAEELGLGAQTMDDLSGRSPKAVLKYFDMKAEPTTPASSGSINTEGVTQAVPELSAKVPQWATTDEMVQAFRNAKEMVKRDLEE